MAALYVWQVSLSAAWYETLAYAEAVVRNAVDMSLRRWNREQGRSEDWLDDAGTPLAGLVSRASSSASSRAAQAALRRGSEHPRQGAPVSLDDRVAQLDLGNLVFVFPIDVPTQRDHQLTGLSGRENLWVRGLSTGYPGLTAELHRDWGGLIPPGLPPEVRGGYLVGGALERLRRLRNRVGHHEQTFNVQHERRLDDVGLLLRSIDRSAAQDVSSLDRVRRTLAMRPQP